MLFRQQEESLEKVPGQSQRPRHFFVVATEGVVGAGRATPWLRIQHSASVTISQDLAQIAHSHISPRDCNTHNLEMF